MPATRKKARLPEAVTSASLLATLFFVVLVTSVIAFAQTSSLVVVPGTTWAARFDGPAHNTDRRPVMAVDAQGSVYVAAETKSLDENPRFPSTPDMDIVTVKYDANGLQQWAAVFDGEGNFLDYPNDVGVDSRSRRPIVGSKQNQI